jgi:hypothetical protein
METAEQYLEMAAECDRLAGQLPAHAADLQSIAEAWRMLAVAAARVEKAPERASSSASSARM